jgi:hypothetical protein
VPEFILHRANYLEQSKLAEGFSGAEIDLRVYFGKIVLAHDPFTRGVSFIDWLSSFTGKCVILNAKETGLEEEIVKIINLVAPQIEYFFLDLPTPSLIQAAQSKIPVAVRVSEVEPIEITSKILSKWIWLDSFSGNWAHLEEMRVLRSNIPQRICLVSPELQGRWPNTNSEEFDWLKGYLRENPGQIQAICTKDRKFWND